MSDIKLKYLGENKEVMYFDVIHKHVFYGTVEVKKAETVTVTLGDCDE